MSLFSELQKIPGGYVYSGACSYQICFPLKSGGELRFGVYDFDENGNESTTGPDDIRVDFYSGELSGVGISGPVSKTGER